MLLTFFLIFVIISIIVITTIVHEHSQASSIDNTLFNPDPDPEPEPINKSKPKIGAEVDEQFYVVIQTYCKDNSMTVSDLIRNSIKFYIESK